MSQISAAGTNVPVSLVHHSDAFDVHVDTKGRSARNNTQNIAVPQIYISEKKQSYGNDRKDVEACASIDAQAHLGSPFQYHDEKRLAFPVKPSRGNYESDRRRALRHRARLCCTLTVGLGSLMIGTIVAVLLFVYALNIERLWMSEFARGGSGLEPSNPGTGHDGASGGVQGVKRRWLHSHNDEMRGKDALTLALDLGYGSIEIDTWLGATPASSSAVKSSHKKRNLLNVRPLADLFQPSVYDDSYFFLPMERRRLADGGEAQEAGREQKRADPASGSARDLLRDDGISLLPLERRHAPAERDSTLDLLRNDGIGLLPLERRRESDEEANRKALREKYAPKSTRKSALSYLFEPSYNLVPLERRTVSDDTMVAGEKQAVFTPDPALTLLTGHKVKDLSDRTLAGLYLEPLLARLEKNNEGRQANESVVGLYADDPTAEVQIVIDMKSDGDLMWPYVLHALKPFQDKGYLTTYDTVSGTWSRSALMIIGTGNTPLHHVYHSQTRVVFYDAPLKALDKPATIPATPAGPAATFEWDRTIAPMASAKFPVLYHVALGLPPWNPVVQQLLRFTAEARAKGISSRWWGAARYPEWMRRRMWAVQKQGGATWIGADDLVDAEAWLAAWEAR